MFHRRGRMLANDSFEGTAVGRAELGVGLLERPCSGGCLFHQGRVPLRHGVEFLARLCRLCDARSLFACTHRHLGQQLAHAARRLNDLFDGLTGIVDHPRALAIRTGQVDSNRYQPLRLNSRTDAIRQSARTWGVRAKRTEQQQLMRGRNAAVCVNRQFS